MSMMELIQTEDHLILLKVTQSEQSLWISRVNGQLSLRPSWDLAGETSPECLGAVFGLVGVLTNERLDTDHLVLLREIEEVTKLTDPAKSSTQHTVYMVKSVSLVPITASHFVIEPPLKSCPKHHVGVVDPTSGVEQGEPKDKFPFKSLGGKIRSAGESLKSTAGSVGVGIAAQVVKVQPWKGGEGRAADIRGEKLERRLLDEFCKLFNDSRAFYLSCTGDLTNSLQRQYEDKELNRGLPLSKRLDDRFFFNKFLLKDLLALPDPGKEDWIIPIIQGYVESKECSIDMPSMIGGYEDPRLPSQYSLCLISRRARERAGTRYKRRGVNEAGNVANYVETEQLILYHSYSLSYVQIRGSIPVFWSQPGIKYRPPPRIDRSEEENQKAFAFHFREQLDVYGPVACINLVNRTGREKILSDVFLENILILNQHNVSFISFDFHEYCRGMRFENVSILLENIQEIMSKTGYFWLDSHGKVCDQVGVFRVNCVDCLDRTNVVQTAMARAVLETQLTKLGVVQPEHGLSSSCKKNFQGLWANNGDLLSRQYAGTNALKGDFTRTGERNLSGLVKDGVNSASRYYLNHIRDTYRQAAIDMLIGNEISEDLFKTEKDVVDDVDGGSDAGRVKVVIEDCLKLLTQDTDQVLGSWGLIDADPLTGDPGQEGLDIVFILTDDSYYYARYDDDLDKITEYQRVLLAEIVKIEFGVPEQSFNLSFLNKTEVHCFRIQYRVDGEDGYHHMFRSTNLRFFNNIATELSSDDEKVESLKAIADNVGVAMETAGLTPDMWFGRLEKRKARTGPTTIIHNPVDLLNLQAGSLRSGTRSPGKLRNVGSKAFSNVTSQFSKLNPISRLRRGDKKEFTDIRQEDPTDSAVEAFEGGDRHYPPTHLASSGLLINRQEGQVNVCLQNNSITYIKEKSSQPPQINVIEMEDGPSLSSPTRSANPSNLKPRSRKISRSSEDISGTSDMDNTLGTVLLPFGKLARSLQSLGSTLETKLSVLEPELEPEFTDLERRGVGPRRPEGFGTVLQRKLEHSSCQSLILTI